MDFLDALKQLLNTLPKPPETPEMTQEVEDSYKAYGFDPKNPPGDTEMAQWAMELINKWCEFPNEKMNLPLTALCISFQQATWGKLNELDIMNLKTMVSAVYNMGYCMALYKMKNPFDDKPKPQDLN